MTTTPSQFNEDDLNRALRELTAPPPELVDRVLRHCRAAAALDDYDGDGDFAAPSDAEFLRPDGAATEARRPRWRFILSHLATAAAVAICCSAITTLVLRAPTSHDTPARDSLALAAPTVAPVNPVPAAPVVALAPTPAVAAVAEAPAAIPAQQGYSLAESRRLHAVLSGDAGTAAAVSLGGSSSIQRRRTTTSTPQELPDSITQLWLGDDPAAARDCLETLARQLPEMRVERLKSPDESCELVRVTAKDSAIQTLVDELHRQPELALLSPALPQPGEAETVAFSGKTVSCTMKFAPRR